MNKSELVSAAADKANLPKGEVNTALEALVDTITETVARGDKVSVTGFGTFERRERRARTGRNPQTGEQMEIKASMAPAFKAGKSFKDAVAE